MPPPRSVVRPSGDVRRGVLRVGLAALAIGLGSFSSTAQSAKTPDNALVAALVWGEYDGIDLSKYPPQVKAELERASERFEANVVITATK